MCVSWPTKLNYKLIKPILMIWWAGLQARKAAPEPPRVFWVWRPKAHLAPRRRVLGLARFYFFIYFDFCPKCRTSKPLGGTTEQRPSFCQQWQVPLSTLTFFSFWKLFFPHFCFWNGPSQSHIPPHYSLPNYSLQLLSRGGASQTRTFPHEPRSFILTR